MLPGNLVAQVERMRELQRQTQRIEATATVRGGAEPRRLALPAKLIRSDPKHRVHAASGGAWCHRERRPTGSLINWKYVRAV